MNHEDAARAAALLWRIRLEQRRIDALPPELRPATLNEGYAIQDAMVEIARQPVVGWKIAATSAAGQKHIGVTEPLSGRLFRDFVLTDGAHRPAAPLHMRVAETEFAFKMGRALPPRGRDYDMGEVCDAVGALHLAIEIPDARYEVFDTIGAPSIAADDAFASWFVLGPEVPGWRRYDPPNLTVRGVKNGAVVAEGTGAAVLGDPRVALTWIANHLARRGIGLKEADIVTTGTWVKPIEIAPGDTVIADFGQLGTVTARFD
ncbi:MAG TPA: fumarylacetoacetate hydrolase family protein [Candidatus Cybelea sp.]|nr:fumarylacetoacetate hydrolase family protein [Candidatus Cybelea sp.]